MDSLSTVFMLDCPGYVEPTPHWSIFFIHPFRGAVCQYLARAEKYIIFTSNLP